MNLRRRAPGGVLEYHVLCIPCGRARIAVVSGQQAAATPRAADLLAKQAARAHLRQAHAGEAFEANPFEVIRFQLEGT